MAIGSLAIGVFLEGSAFHKALDRIERQVSRTGRRFTDIGQKMTAGLTLPLAAVGGVAIKSSIEFESAFAGVVKTVDATTEELAALRSGIIQMAEKIPASTTEISKVAEAAGQLGIQTKNIMSFTRVMIDLGETTNLSADTAATQLARLANITQMSQGDFDRLGSTVVALGNKLATTEAEIVEMGLRLAGAGKQVGLTEAQILSFAGALSSVGIEAQAGGSAVSRVMIDIGTAVAEGGKKLDQFAVVAGMSSSKFAAMFRTDAAGAIVAFIEGLKRMSNEGKNVFGVLEQLGLSEIRVQDALLRASNAGELFRNSLQIGSEAWKQNSALTDEAAKRYATVQSQLEVLRNRFNNVAIALGDALVPALIDALQAAEPLFNAISSMARQFADLDPSTQRVVVAVGAFAAALGPLAIAVGTVVSAMSTLAPLISALTGPIGLVVTAIGLWVVKWKEISEGSVVIAQWMVDTIASVFQKGFKLITEPVRAGVETITGHFRRMYDVVVGNSIVPDMVKMIGDWMGRLKTAMGNPTEKAVSRVARALEGLKTQSAQTMGGLTSKLMQGALSFEQFADRAVQALLRVAAQQAAMAIGGPYGAFIGGFLGGFFAGGGRPPMGEISVVGERGPELFVPDTAGTIVPLRPALAGAGGGGGGIVFHQQFTITGMDFGSAETARKLMQIQAAQVRAGAIEGVTLARALDDRARLTEGRSHGA